jgi:hypothetical protein
LRNIAGFSAQHHPSLPEAESSNIVKMPAPYVPNGTTVPAVGDTGMPLTQWLVSTHAQ